MRVDDLGIYGFVDPAGGKRSTLTMTRARSAIVVIGVDSLERVFVLYCWADRAPTNILVDKIFSVRDRFHPRVYGCEANAQQSLFVDAVRYVGATAGKAISLVPVNQPTKLTKVFRIRTILQPIISSGRLFVPEDSYELRAELQAFPLGATVDLVDALASACSLVPSRPLTMRIEQEKDHLAEYLTTAGMDQGEIEQTMLQLELEDKRRG